MPKISISTIGKNYSIWKLETLSCFICCTMSFEKIRNCSTLHDTNSKKALVQTKLPRIKVFVGRVGSPARLHLRKLRGRKVYLHCRNFWSALSTEIDVINRKNIQMRKREHLCTIFIYDWLLFGMNLTRCWNLGEFPTNFWHLKTIINLRMRSF